MTFKIQFYQLKMTKRKGEKELFNERILEFYNKMVLRLCVVQKDTCAV